MLTSEQLQQRNEELTSIKEQVDALNHKAWCIRKEIVQHNIEVAWSRFPGLMPGDKVEVEHKFWWDKEKPTKETLYFHKFAVDAYRGDSTNPEDVWGFFFKTKKDGSKSLREANYPIGSIVSIEKL